MCSILYINIVCFSLSLVCRTQNHKREPNGDELGYSSQIQDSDTNADETIKAFISHLQGNMTDGTREERDNVSMSSFDLVLLLGLGSVEGDLA